MLLRVYIDNSQRYNSTGSSLHQGQNVQNLGNLWFFYFLWYHNSVQSEMQCDLYDKINMVMYIICSIAKWLLYL